MTTRGDPCVRGCSMVSEGRCGQLEFAFCLGGFWFNLCWDCVHCILSTYLSTFCFADVSFIFLAGFFSVRVSVCVGLCPRLVVRLRPCFIGLGHTSPISYDRIWLNICKMATPPDKFRLNSFGATKGSNEHMCALSSAVGVSECKLLDFKALYRRTWTPCSTSSIFKSRIPWMSTLGP